jgi:uncharacterized membrane protein
LSARLVIRLLLCALFAAAGVVHITNPALFFPIMPPIIPFRWACVVFSGVLELLGAAGLLVPQRRIQQLTGVGLSLLLVAVFPANIYMAAENIRIHGIPSQPWMGWARLPLQPVLILAVLWVTRLWPPARTKTSP